MIHPLRGYPTPSPATRVPGLPPARSYFRKLVNWVMTVLAALAALIAVGALGLVYLLIRGLGSLNLHILTEGPKPMGVPGGGLRNGIVGTLVLLAVASV